MLTGVSLLPACSQRNACIELMFRVLAASSGSESIVREFTDTLARNPDTAVAVAAIKVRAHQLFMARQCMVLTDSCGLGLAVLPVRSYSAVDACIEAACGD